MNKKQLMLLWVLAAWTVVAVLIAGVECKKRVDCNKALSFERASCEVHILNPLPPRNEAEPELAKVGRLLSSVERDIERLEKRNLRVGTTDAQWWRLQQLRRDKMALVRKQEALQDKIRQAKHLWMRKRQYFRETYTTTECGWNWRSGPGGSSLRKLVFLLAPALGLAVPLWLALGRRPS